MSTPAISLSEVPLPAIGQPNIAQVDDATNHTIAKVVLQIIQSYLVPYQFSRCRTFVSQSLHLSCIGMCNRDGDLELAGIHSGGGVKRNISSRLSKGILSESFCEASLASLSTNARMVLHRDHFWVYNKQAITQFSNAPHNFSRSMALDGIFLSDERSATIIAGIGNMGYRAISLAPTAASNPICLGSKCLHVMGGEDDSAFAVAEKGIFVVDKTCISRTAANGTITPPSFPTLKINWTFNDATSHPDGTRLFTASGDDCLIYKVSDWSMTKFPLQGHNRSLSVCDSSMASLGNSSCRIWDIELQRPLLTIPLPNTTGYSRCLLARSSLVIENDSAPPNRNILLFDTREPPKMTIADFGKND